MKDKNRMIQVQNGVIGPRESRLRKIAVKAVGDYSGVSPAYLEAAQNYGPDLAGPPLCDEHLALIQHMFTEEEASVIRHLKPKEAKTAYEIAEAAKRPVEEVRPILDWLAEELVGCGLCVVACSKDQALTLKPVPGYQPPEIRKSQRRSVLSGLSG